MPQTPDPLQLDHFLCFSLYATTHAMQRVYAPMLADLGLTYPQYLAMVVLWERDDCTVGELGQRLLLESSTLTPLLKRLEAAGLLSRARDLRDERQVRVRLTAAGRDLRSRAEPIPACVFEASGMCVDELVALKQQLDALRERLNARELAAPASATRGEAP